MAQQHIVLLPVMAHGHMIPMLEMAKLFISRGTKTTIIATPPFADPIRRAQQLGYNIGLTVTKFPPQGSPLPENIVSLDQMTAPDSIPKFFEALSLLQEPVEMILKDLNPDCLVSDKFLSWTSESASKLGIPRLVFNGTGFFALCTDDQMRLHKPYNSVESDFQPFVLRDLPHDKLSFVRTQVWEYVLKINDDHVLSKFQEKMRESEERSYGVIINSFYELESAYADHYKNVMGKKAWPIGPLFLCNNRDERKEPAIYEHNCVSWLDSKKPNSVIYMCFGSMSAFSVAQMQEMAVGIEASGQEFIWVVRKGGNGEENGLKWLLSFEERMKGKGLIIRGWAPQMMILDHPATGAFVTHCGWNSILEAVCAGMPMVTWPLFAEQFYNEKLVTEILRIGVSVGNKKWQTIESEGVRSEDLREAVRRVMVGEEACEVRSRAKYYKEMARKAVEEGGSSYTSLSALIDEVSIYGKTKEHHICS